MSAGVLRAGDDVEVEVDGRWLPGVVDVAYASQPTGFVRFGPQLNLWTTFGFQFSPPVRRPS